MTYTQNTRPDLSAEADYLRQHASSMDDIKAWMLGHAELLGEVPTELLPRVTVEIEVHQSDLDHLVKKNGMWLNVTFEVSKKETDQNPVEAAFRLVRGQTKTVYSRFYHMPLPFKEWPLCTAWLAFEYLKEDVHESYVQPAREKLAKYLPKYFPALTVETLEQLRDNDLLPKEKTAFTQFMLATRVGPAVNPIEVPADLIAP